MKKMTKVLLATSVLPIVLGSASAFAKGGNNDDFRSNHRNFRDNDRCEPSDGRGMMRELNLTQEQQTKLRDMRQAERTEMQKERQEMRGQMQSFHQKENQLMLAKNFDQKAAEKLAKQMVDVQAAHRAEMMQKRFEMMNILTPEQKAKFTELQQQRFAKMEECDFGPGQRQHGPQRSMEPMGNGPRR